MGTQISPMLAVSDGAAAIEFYKAAFGASVLWRLGGGGHIVAGLSIDGARFFLAQESPPYGTRSPGSVGFTTVRIELLLTIRSPCRPTLWPPALSSTVR
jgi:PhnB protein